MQRTYHLVELFDAVERTLPSTTAAPWVVEVEWGFVRDLAAVLATLESADERCVRGCSDDLRSAVCDLMELSGPVADPIHLRVAVERLALPAFQGRALSSKRALIGTAIQPGRRA